jgi:hypothetical protein
MLIFLVRRYCLTAGAATLLFVALPLTFGSPLWPTVATGISLAAPLAVVITWRDLRRQNYWVLYDNLGVGRMPVLCVCCLILIALGLAIRVID